MEPMIDKRHLQLRGNVWHYYRRVPKHLVPVMGRPFIKKSLGTSDLRQARKLRTIEDLQFDATVASIEAGASVPLDSAVSAKASLPMLIEHVRSMVGKQDKAHRDDLILDPVEDEGDRRERRSDVEYGLGILDNPSDPRRDEWLSKAQEELLAEAGGSLADAEAAARFRDAVLRGLKEVQWRKLDRYDGRHDRPFLDPLFDPKRPAAVSFRELADTFLAERAKEYELNGVNAKRLDMLRAQVNTVVEIVGEDVAVHDIDDDVVQRVRSALARMPANRSKAYPGVSLAKVLERAQKDQRSTLSPVTQARYLDNFEDVLKVAVRKKLLSHNPADGVKPLVKDKTPGEEKRLPWSNEQIKGFFEGTFYRSCASGAPNPYSKADRDWRFWLPLVMLFSGARPNEIAQLRISDIRRTSSGVCYFEVTDSGGRSVKTKASRRRVPLHSELVKLGFLDFVARRRQDAGSEEAYLFAGLKPDKYGNRAWYAVKRLGEHFIPQEIELARDQTLYSLRHNVRDALRRAKAPADTLLAVTGWSPAGRAVSDSYGDPGNPDFHVEWVEKISYPGLDLSFLHREPSIGTCAPSDDGF